MVKIVLLAAPVTLAISLTGLVFTYKTPEIVKTDTPKEIIPDFVHNNVPFTAQAPFGNWRDSRQESGCEEASVIMAMHWVMDKELTREKALKEIIAASNYQRKTYGYFADTSAKDTLDRVFKEYFRYDRAILVYNVNADQIRRELARNQIAIVPVNGRILKNPHYVAPGPIYHTIVIIGYDDEAQQFITHDPGTRFGKNFRYSYKTIDAALQDYESGDHEEVLTKRTAMILVSKN